jgi:pimeloyl-ACP methyl ester carboxylesterase
VARETVVFLHGIWMVGAEMSLLRHRVERCGFETCQFRYQSLRKTPRENAAALNGFLHRIDADIIHLVGHSLGGIVILHLFRHFPDQKPGRVVMLGTPVQGSQVADQVQDTGWMKPVLGRATEQGLLGDAPRWESTRELGMIAGTKGIGVGLLLTRGRLPQPHDGTVRLEATQTSGLTDHLAVPYTHSGMLFARPVAQAVCQFLKTGQFT